MYGRSTRPEIGRFGVGSPFPHYFSSINDTAALQFPQGINCSNMHESAQNVTILYSSESMVVLLEIFGKRSAGASDDTIANVPP